MNKFNHKQTEELAKLVSPDRFSTGRSNLELHRRDISPHRGELPAAVVWPESTAEVSAILRWSYAQEVPVTPWGAGTSTEGNPVPARGGLVVDLTRMDRILDIRPQDLQADVQPGVLRKEFNRQAGRHGLFFPPDPGADATIGGMIANNASGVQTVKYGATKDYTLRLINSMWSAMSSAMPATATCMSFWWGTPATSKGGVKSKKLTTALSLGPSSWEEPAPVNTASASANGNSCNWNMVKVSN